MKIEQKCPIHELKLSGGLCNCSSTQSPTTPPHITKKIELFKKKFTEPDYGWGSEGYEIKLSKTKPQKIIDFLTQALQESYELGKNEKSFWSESLAQFVERKEFEKSILTTYAKELMEKVDEFADKLPTKNDHCKYCTGLLDGNKNAINNVKEIINQSIK